jgi:histidine triad (HIT) family protein
MDDCIFCKIASGQIPCAKIAENKDFFAFLDIKPLSTGHTLIIPKIHYRWTYDVPNFGEYWEFARTVGNRLIEVIKPEYLSYWTYGQEVPHAHIHIVPRYSNDAYTGITRHGRQDVTSEELDKLSKLLKL